MKQYIKETWFGWVFILAIGIIYVIFAAGSCVDLSSAEHQYMSDGNECDF